MKKVKIYPADYFKNHFKNNMTIQDVDEDGEIEWLGNDKQFEKSEYDNN